VVGEPNHVLGRVYVAVFLDPAAAFEDAVGEGHLAMDRPALTAELRRWHGPAQNDDDWLRKFYWGPKRKLWSGGYFCATVGDASEDTIRKYIENQG